MFDDLEMLIIAIIIGVLVAVVQEFIIKALYSDMTTQKLNLLNVFLGWLFGMVALLLFSGEFVTFSILGLAGGVWSPGIYDVIVKGLNLKGDSN